MLNNETEKNCGFADEIVAYIYDEIGEPKRSKFETHLVDCISCTDEFAGISNARFAMFEWQKEEFAPLSTPQIIIPYAPKQQAIEKGGLFAGLSELLGLGGWSSAALVAGALAIVVGLGFVVMNYNDGPQVAENGKTNVNQQKSSLAVAQNPEKVGIPNATLPKELNSTGTSTLVSNASKSSREVRPVRTLLKTQQNHFNNNLIASRQKRKAPALTAFDDDADNSLRLADLFEDELGSIRR